MADDVVLYEVREPGIALITLNRPERLNAWTGAMGAAYYDALDRAAADDAVRVIIVTGAGRGFCAGADMQGLQAIGASGGRADERGDDPSKPQRVFHHALSVPKPIIAAVNGACAGMGFSHAMVCDLRFAAAGAKFTTAFVRRGLIAEWALAWTLQRVAGPARALDVLMSGRVVLAEEAKELGIVNDVLPADQLLDHCVAYATELIRNCSPSSMAAIKRQVWRAGEQTIDESLTWAIELMKASLTQADFKEGVASFVEKRPPAFAPVTRGWATDIEP
jgi:enoyl-CoA hydratase/carnithine racemase